MKHLPRIIMDWLERGDLVPLIVLVSAVHYAVILSGHDLWPVAIAIGILVDLGHYRWTRAAVRYHPAIPKAKGKRRLIQRERLARWGMALVMTVISLAYQQRYYDDWWYSIPLPLLIISLAWLGEKDKRQVSAEKQVSPNVEIIPKVETVKVKKLPEKIYWPKLPAEDKLLISGMTTKEISKTYNVPERTALNWRKYSIQDNRQETSIISSNGNGKVKNV